MNEEGEAIVLFLSRLHGIAFELVGMFTHACEFQTLLEAKEKCNTKYAHRQNSWHFTSESHVKESNIKMLLEVNYVVALVDNKRLFSITSPIFTTIIDERNKE